MTPVLAVFIDALKPESVEHMEFLKTFENKARVKTELPSYSSTCHASIYTGVYPNKHKHLFIWSYSPQDSPFQRIVRARLHKFVQGYNLKRLCYAISLREFLYGTALYGFPLFAKHSIAYWANFKPSVVKFWGKPDTSIGKYPTIFSILNDAGIKYQVIWAAKGSLERIKIQNQPKPFTYIFIGHMDPLSHTYGQESPEAKKTLKRIDRVLEDKFSQFKNAFGDDFVFLVFSDHGHARVKEKVDLYSHFKLNGRNLNDYPHFIDSCYARFWFKNEKEREEVEKVLCELGDKGFILTDNILRKYHAEMSVNEYGDLIFYLEKPCVFDVVGKCVSMHGYLPDHPELDGVCVSNREIAKPYIKLEDIAPSILQAFHLEIHDYMDGEPIWK